MIVDIPAPEDYHTAAVVAYQQQFVGKASSLLDQMYTFRILDVHLKRLSEIALSEEDRSFRLEDRASRQLHGRIELRAVSYRYGAEEPLVLDNVDLSVGPGEHVAITGVSGGGKSTLAKILLGLVEPESGSLEVDGKALQSFGYRCYRDQVSAVLQEDSLFAGSLLENITLFDDSPCVERVIEAAKAASIHDEIDSTIAGYATLVGDMGSTLSGGQKQRILLARALYRSPKILVLDEATAHLDPGHEQAVMESISALGVTRIVIAHRFETVVAADRIFNLAAGKLAPIEKSAFVALRRAS